LFSFVVFSGSLLKTGLIFGIFGRDPQKRTDREPEKIIKGTLGLLKPQKDLTKFLKRVKYK